MWSMEWFQLHDHYSYALFKTRSFGIFPEKVYIFIFAGGFSDILHKSIDHLMYER